MKNILFLNASQLIKRGIAWGFIKNGWNTFYIAPDGYTGCTQVEAIRKNVEENKIDVVFIEFCAGWEWNNIFKYCEKAGVLFIVWGIEDTLNNYQWVTQVVKNCHKYYTTVEEFIPDAKRDFNKEIKLLQFGVNSEFHKPTIPNKVKFPYDIVLVANNYSSRYDVMKWYLEPLLNDDYNIGIYGVYWWIQPEREFNLCNHMDKYKGVLDYALLPEIYSTVPVVLGVNCSGESISQQSMRAFEYGGCAYNSCLVSFYTKAQERYFGDMIYLPRNTDETKFMIKEVLDMSDEQRICKADKLREFVYCNHNYIDRAKFVIDNI